MPKGFSATKINTNLFPESENSAENNVVEKVKRGSKKGKPYLPPDRRRTEHVNITLTKDINISLEKLAYKDGLSKSNFVQHLIIREVNNRKEELAEIEKFE